MQRRAFNLFSVMGLASLSITPRLVGAKALLDGIELNAGEERGQTELGWLDSRHSFSFGSYWNSERNGFSHLRVINEDRLAPSEGFGKHPHHSMEIITFVLSGVLQHRDTLGNEGVIRPGDVQIMSAGSGIMHSELNPSPTESVHFLQIWIIPDSRGGVPLYQQRHFADEERRGRLVLTLSPDGKLDSLRIRQDCKVYSGLFDNNEQTELIFDPGRDAYIHLIKGTLKVNGFLLKAGDGLQIRCVTPYVRFSDGENAEVLVFNLRADWRQRGAGQLY